MRRAVRIAPDAQQPTDSADDPPVGAWLSRAGSAVRIHVPQSHGCRLHPWSLLLDPGLPASMVGSVVRH